MSAYDTPKKKRGLPNPFRTFSQYIYPRTINDVFIWAAYLWERNPKYRTAVQKVVSYFVSDVTITPNGPKKEVDTEAMNGFKELLTEDYGILQLVLQFGQELAAMGNVFVSAEPIFSRELLCPTEGCGWQMHLKNLRKGRDYTWSGSEFTGVCPQCGKRVTYRIKDVKSVDSEGRKVRFVFRPAEDMRLQFNRLSNTYKYLYKIPDDIASAIKRGDSIYLEDSPRVFLDAVAAGERLIEFPADKFFSMRTKTLAGMDRLYKGWGLPLFMAAFDNVVRIQNLDKFNEAVIMDYLVPTRIISPQPANLAAGVDPNRQPLSGSTFREFMQAAIRGRITNPTQWIISPVPVQQEQVGGNKDVIPVELLEWETSQMLSDISIPQEFKQENFQTVAPTMGLRMFERNWVHFAKGMGAFVKWAADIIGHQHQMEDMKCKLDMTSFVEDDMNKQVLLSLMQGGMIARGPVLKKLGVDFEDDTKLKIKEQQMEADAAMEQQKDQQGVEMVDSVVPPAASVGIGQAQMNIQMMQQQAQGGGEGMPAGPEQPAMPAAPAGAGGPAGMPFNTGASQSASIEQMFQEAQQMAQQLYNAPPNIRRQQLVQLKATNPSMHAQVTQILEDMSQQVASEAVAQSKQPQ